MIRTITLYATFFVIILSNTIHAQWVNTSGPYGGQIWHITSAGGKLFAASPYFGVLVSSDKGTSWNPTSLTENSFVVSLASDGNKVYAGTHGGKLFLSNDLGATWNEIINNNGFPNCGIGSILCTEGTIYLNFDGRWIYSSTDSGTTWQRAASPYVASTSYIYSLISNSSGLFAAGINFISYSNDMGRTWTQCGDPLFSKPVTALFSFNDLLLAGTNEEGIFYSTNSGGT